MSWSYLIVPGALAAFLVFEFLYPPKAPTHDQADGEPEESARGRAFKNQGKQSS
jgi:hypothetical protein